MKAKRVLHLRMEIDVVNLKIVAQMQNPYRYYRIASYRSVLCLLVGRIAKNLTMQGQQQSLNHGLSGLKNFADFW